MNLIPSLCVNWVRPTLSGQPSKEPNIITAEHPRTVVMGIQCLLILLPGLLLTAKANAEITLSIGPSVEPTRATLVIEGDWPNECAPVLLRADSSNNTLQVFAELPSDGLCRSKQSSYRFAIPYDPIDIHRLELLLRRSPDQAYQLQEFALLNDADRNHFRPESGWWWSQSEGLFDSGGPGTGLTLDVQDDILTVLSQSFDSAGRPSWRMAAGRLHANQFSAPLARFEGGQQFTGPYQAPVLSDDTQTLHLEFTGPITATAWYTQRLGNDPVSPLSMRIVSLVRYSAKGSLLERMLNGQFALIWNENQQWRTRIIDISGFEWTSEEQLQLLDSEGEELGRCEASSDNAEIPPEFCVINQPGQAPVVLSEMGLQQSRGRDLRGEFIRMVRIN